MIQGDNVTVIDGVGDSVITTIAVGDKPCAFAWNPVQNRIYVANYGSSSISVIRDVTGIEEGDFLTTRQLALEVSPNPFYSSTRIKYSLEHPGNVLLKIYNINGECVGTLVNRKLEAGFYEVNWDGKDNNRSRLPQGCYFLRMQAGARMVTANIVLLY